MAFTQTLKTFEHSNKFFTEKLQVESAGGGENFLDFNIPRSVLEKLPEFFAELERKAEKLGVSDVQLSLTTLESVFLKISEEDEIETEKKK